MKKIIKEFSESYIAFVAKYYKPIFLISVILFLVLGWYSATHLRLNNNLSTLLPTHTPSVIALKESTQRFGSSDKFLIAIQGSDPVLVAEIQDSLKNRIEADWKDIALYTQIERDNQFFIDNALLYLPVHHLERIRDNLIVIQKDMSGAINPLFVDISGDSSPSDSGKTNKKEKEELVWFDSSIPQELGLPDEAASAFEGFYEANNKETKTEQAEKWDPKGILPEHLKNRLIGQHKTDKTINGVVEVKLTGSSTDLDFTNDVLNRANILLDDFRERTFSSPMRFSVEGSYEGLKDAEQMKADGIVATIISCILIFILVVGFFRSLLSAILLLSQVLFASVLMLFFTSVFYGQLNPYTLFVGAIIIGMGIDFSIHMMGTAQRLITETGDLKKSLSETIDHLMYPMFLAAITTVAGLLTLLIADFKGFYEFGVIASVGVTLSAITAVLGLPVLIILAGGLPVKRTRSLLPLKWSERDIEFALKKASIILMIVIVGLSVFFNWAEFEHNFQNLKAPKKEVESAEPKMHYGTAIEGKRKSSQPAAVLGDSRQELDKLYDSLMVRLRTDKDPMLKSFLTLKTFVPEAEEQEERIEVIEEIADIINARVFSRVKGDDSVMVHKLRNMVEAEEFDAEDLPPWSLDMLREKDGSYGEIGFIYGSYKSWDAREMREFQDRYGHWNFGGEDLRVYSSAFILSDVIQAVKEDSIKMGIFIFIVLLITLSLALRNTKLIFICMASITASILLTIGLMGLTNFSIGLGKITIYNVIIIPMALGVGIDATIHLVLSWYRYSHLGLRHLFDTTGRMVMAASLTTVAGFLGVLFIEHKGMRTIGELAVMAIFSTLICAILLTPWLATIFLKKPLANKNLESK
jgi:predicted RND superfamily exporter protein